MKRYIYCIICLYSTSLFAWNATGHRLIAQIAYDSLTPKAKHFFNKKNSVLNHHHKSYNLVNSAVWMDHLYAPEFNSLRPMHYIDLPFTRDGSPLPKSNKINAIVAINMSKRTLLNPAATPLEQAIAVRLLWHVVGDIHQPLHAVTCVSQHYPKGDQGGNLYKLKKNPIAKNLHAYWDKGGGLLSQNKRYRQQEIKQLATQLEKQWPCNPATVDTNPFHWALESHELSKKNVYNIHHHTPDAAYQQKAQLITAKRIAIAGCRLAAVSMKIMDAPKRPNR